MNYQCLPEKQQRALAEILNHIKTCLPEGDHFKETNASRVMYLNLRVLPQWIAEDILCLLLTGGKQGIVWVLEEYSKQEVA